MKIICVIPARYASTRYPGKPLALIDGKPMIQWVYNRAVAAGIFDEIIVATDNERIAQTVAAFNGRRGYSLRCLEGLCLSFELSGRSPGQNSLRLPGGT